MLKLNEMPNRIRGHRMSDWEPIWSSDNPRDTAGTRHRVCVNCNAEQIAYLDEGEVIETNPEFEAQCPGMPGDQA